MKSDRKTTEEKLAVLLLADELGNVAEACRRSGISRRRYYAWRRSYQVSGLHGLKDKRGAQYVPEELADMIQTLALDYPGQGCKYIDGLLAAHGQRVSAMTIQRCLNAAGLGNRYDRWLALEQLWAETPGTLSATQVAFMERWNPQFGERHAPYTRPGELLCVHAFSGGRLRNRRPVYLHAVVDTCTCYAWASADYEKCAGESVAVLDDMVFPYYKAQGIGIKALAADSGIEYPGGEDTRGMRPQDNGFMQRFMRTVREEFFQRELKTKAYRSQKVIQKQLDEWLSYYNCERPHHGYPNMGLTPEQAMMRYRNLKG